jgi:protein-tyrosine phosphatase
VVDSPARGAPKLGLEGCLNFRDLGGYPASAGTWVRRGQVYRSDALHHLTPGDVVCIRDELGVREIVDLRSSAELHNEGRGLLEAEAIRFVHLPLFDGQAARPEGWAAIGTLGERYFLLAEFAKEPIARLVTTLADASGPVVYHCAAGKDRTGVVSAILLGLLGVRDDVIVADYVATQENLDAIIERLLSTEGYQTILAALPADTMHAESTTMVEFLARMRERYGSMRAYAAEAGVAEPALDRLADRLLTRER